MISSTISMNSFSANKWKMLPWLVNHGNPALSPKEKEEGSRYPGKRKGRVDDNEICLTANEYKELLELLG